MLPWPWGGETFEIARPKPVTFITGPLGSGKTQLLRAIATALPDTMFMSMDGRLEDGAAIRARTATDRAFAERIEMACEQLRQDGADINDALIAVIAALEDQTRSPLVIDLIEHGLDHATQEALAVHIRRMTRPSRPLFLTTRSTAILDLADLGHDEMVLYCPANHGPPIEVAPYPGASGYEAVTHCLASPEIRARTAGVVAMRVGGLM